MSRVRPTTKIAITSTSVGQSFAVVGEVWRVRGNTRTRRIHTTKPYPMGFIDVAHQRAYEWATAKGYRKISIHVITA